MFEIAHSDFAKEHKKAEENERADEDKNDVKQRAELVTAANVAAPFPYSPQQIRVLLRSRAKDLDDYSFNMH